jgi:hypothetical protein
MRNITLVASMSVLFLATACSKSSFVGGKNDGPSPQGPQAPVPPAREQGPVTQPGTITGPVTQPGTVAGPVTQNPVQQNPMQQSPVQQSPVQQSPVIQSPVQKIPVSTRCTSGSSFTANYGYSATLKAIQTYEARIQVALPIADGETKACFLHAVPKVGTAAVTSLPLNRGFVLQSASGGYAFAAGDQTNCKRVGNTLVIGPMNAGDKPFVGYAPVPTANVSNLKLVNVSGHMKPDPTRYDAFPLVTMQSNVCFANFAGYTVLFKDNTVK